jgi:hypothetical protein
MCYIEMMTDNPGGPGDKPAFLNKRSAEAIPYPGDNTPPQFDQELAAWEDPGNPDDGEGYTTDNAPQGQGPSRGYQERWRAIARLHALGMTNNMICKRLGYSPTGVSLALKSEWVQAEVARYRSQYELDIASRVKEASLDSVEYLHGTVLDEGVKDEIRSTNARWFVEKQTGKARQEIGVESNSLNHFTEVLKDMMSRGETLDVTPPQLAAGESKQEKEPDNWDTWLDKNL